MQAGAHMVKLEGGGWTTDIAQFHTFIAYCNIFAYNEFDHCVFVFVTKTTAIWIFS
jgi:hypothetical protein